MSVAHWAKVTLSEIAEVRLGRQRSPKRSVGPNMRPYMRAANVTWKGISLRDVKEMDFTPAEFETYALRRGDLLLSEASGSASEVGKPAVWAEEVPNCCFQNTLIRVRADHNLVPFLHLHLYRDAVTGAFARASRGVGIHHLGAKALSGWEVRLPPLQEQLRIVEAVESYFTRLDDAVATLERVQRNLKRYRASVLKVAVEGRLVPTEAERARAEGRDYEPASVLLERILAERRRRWEEAELAKMEANGKAPKDDKWKAKYKKPVSPDSSSLGELPEGWCWATLDQVVENHDRDRVPVKRADRAKRHGRYPYYGASGVIDSIDGYLFDGSFLLVGEDGANLLARSTPIAFQAHGRFWVNNHAHVLRTHLDLPLGYIEAFFNAIDLARYVTGTAQPKLPQAAMNKIPLPLCPAAEQHRIVEEVERQLSIAEEAKVSLELNTQRCQQLRQSILKWTFEGKLVDQDPTDEPASALLERIASEREAAADKKPKTARRRKARATKI